MARFKVLVVDDSPFMRKVFSDFISADPSFEVAATASDGLEAIEKTLAIGPDVITMDLEMPSMNGLEALRRIMTLRPTPVIMLSAVTDNGTRDTIKALQYGALDFIRKPDGSVKLDIMQVGDSLREKLHVAVELAKSENARMLASADDFAEREEEPKEDSRALAPPAEPAAPPENHKSASSDRLEKLDKPEMPMGRKQPDVLPPMPQKEISSQPAKRTGKLPPTVPKPSGDIPKKASLTRSGSVAEGAAKRNSPTDKLSASSGKLAASTGQDRSKPETRKDSAQSPPDSPEAKRVPFAEAAGSKGKADQKVPGKPTFGHIVAIGTSTGGPRALQEVLTSIPPDFPAPILIVQHMPPKFTHSLAQRLDNFSKIHVCEAADGDLVLTGTAYIAPGGRHMTLARDSAGGYRIALSDDAQVSGHRPSVDRLFESLIGVKDMKRHVVLMTGMGSDGARAMKALQEDGAETLIAESEQTCVVYGMPRSAVELGAASQVLNLQQIAPALVHEVTARKR
ncbi:protein-glutamate methylesterase/protein-glutamine glutaminase [Cohnella thailandensis]|uniref:Protein-glutamate methylesterase/protein-glutamine glutaminase n=1 Tax=Cohnella thailandensis TaxID=557557 RepID=A0A841T6F1_9BACL|nr:chemotaxis response regulator protein-glutamate methylesterase [Cohnella thailandensis]MBB6636721.1 chemotaxis response regulator protein-glutamate methylesterase [Cohnella thailandensis]MBP1973403.1 two-component system chemotaxis response regulator CheB [Cohnella thailandensis]